jgi:hypothetical protein
MPWIKVPAENHAPFVAALPADPRIEIAKMFGGLAAKVNGNIFAGLFGLSAMLLLDEPEKKKALALPGASMFDPMGDGRMRSDKVMLPPAMMKDPKRLSQWLGKAFQFGLTLPAKEAKPKKSAAAKKPAPKAKKASKK